MQNSYFISSRIQFIQEVRTFSYPTEEGIGKYVKQLKQNPPLPLISLREIAEEITIQIGIRVEDIPTLGKGYVDEIEHYLRTGDFEQKTDKIVCVNPTLLTLDDKQWQVNITTTP